MSLSGRVDQTITARGQAATVRKQHLRALRAGSNQCNHPRESLQIQRRTPASHREELIILYLDRDHDPVSVAEYIGIDSLTEVNEASQ